MARVEHVNLVVYSLEKTVDFLKIALPEWSVRGRGSSEWYGVKRQWLHFGLDHSYVTLNDNAVGAGRNLRGVSPGLSHVGIEVESVDDVRERLVGAGYEIATIGADHPHRKTIYFIEPSGTEFEFIEYLSNNPAERNMYGGETSGITRISTGPRD